VIESGAHAKDHWKTKGWAEGRIIPEKPISFIGKMISLVSGDSKKEFCGVNPQDGNGHEPSHLYKRDYKRHPGQCRRERIGK
jgi:hypothetical protein